MKSINSQLYCNLCNCAVSYNKRFLVDSHRNTSKHQKALGNRSENLITHTSQTFSRSSDTDFVEKVTKAFLSAGIPLYRLNNTHIKNLFRDIGHRLPPETTCRWTALQLSKHELKQIRNAVHDKQIFLIVDGSTLSGTQILNILVGSLETPHVGYLYDCQPLKYAPYSNISAQAVDDAVRNLGMNKKLLLPVTIWCREIYNCCWYNTKISVSQAVSRGVRSTFIAQLSYENQISLWRCGSANRKRQSSSN